jgi:hypothetical protein
VLSRARAALVTTALVTLLGAAGCRPEAVDAPYADGKAPTPAQLLERAAPQLPAIQVSQAKVVANRALRGNLAFLAQAPARFRGTVGVAGNELATLAFTEQGYALRYKLDAFPTGFYHGPPSSCAVEALLGVALDESDLVALVLGGAPVIAAPHEVLEQAWDRGPGHERLVIANPSFVQALHFRPIDGQWRFVGGTLWQRNSDGSKGKQLWSLAHEGLSAHGDVVLPERTKIVAPGKRKDNLVTILYKSRELDPAFAKAAPSTGEEGGGNDDGPAPDEGGEWGGDAGWENEGEGGTEPDAAEPEAAPVEPAKPAPAPASKPPSGASAPAIPKVFELQSTGLSDRGDLCR